MGFENVGRRSEIELMDFDVRNRGCYVGERVGGRVEAKLGVEDRVGKLKFVEGVLGKWDVGGFGDEEGEDC